MSIPSVFTSFQLLLLCGRAMANIKNDNATSLNKNKTCLNFAFKDDLIPVNKLKLE
jgi:hypothetical protein